MGFKPSIAPFTTRISTSILARAGERRGLEVTTKPRLYTAILAPRLLYDGLEDP